MARVALCYGTTEGQTGTVAERIADGFADAGHDPTQFHANHLPTDFSLADSDAVVMKHIAKAAGGDTDTSRDYEYTDWDEVESFAAAFADGLD